MIPTKIQLTLLLALLAPAWQAVAQSQSAPVPKAQCGPQDRPETVQGQTTLAERFAPGSPQSYRCNLELIGHFDGEGVGHHMNIFENCAYYTTAPSERLRNRGVAVLDIADSRNPKATAYLGSPAMLDANESLEFDPTRKLLIGAKLLGTTVDIYDLSKDCRQPVLKSSVSIPGVYVHSGQFAPDGRTYYAASYGIRGGPSIPADMTPAVYAIDATDPNHLRSILTWTPPKPEWRTHGLSLNKRGTRAYVAMMREKAGDSNGLLILDLSEVQARRSNAQMRVVGTLFWPETYYAEFTLPITVAGRSYVVLSDIGGAFPIMGSPPPDACDSGKPAWGYARMIDIADERQPRIASQLMLEVHAPANCKKVMHDPVVPLGYGSFGCDVDSKENARLLACGYFEGGLRVFDIRNPARPREVAYYKPPARRTQSRPGSMFDPAQAKSEPKDHTADQVLIPKFRNHGTQIAFTSADNGFQVVRFTNRFIGANPDLFGKQPHR